MPVLVLLIWVFTRVRGEVAAAQLFSGLLAEAPVEMLMLAIQTHVCQETDREVLNSFPEGSQTTITCEG